MNTLERGIVLAAVSGAVLAGSLMAQNATGAQDVFVNTLMPQPAQLTVGEGRVDLSHGVGIAADKFHDDRLDNAIGWFRERLATQTGTMMQAASAPVTITVEGAGEAVQGPDEDESYTLEISAQNGIHLHAATDVGAMRGLETLLQLVQCDGRGFWLPAVSIQDSPRFKWRGLMIDVSRHFEPMGVIERTLDAMAAVKMNVFHWHLSDDQGFRIESKVYPKLTEMGSEGQYYTQEEAKEVVAYARGLGIRVVPEFDMPGHSTSWAVGYPELASGAGPFAVEHHFGVFDPVMDPTQGEHVRLSRQICRRDGTIFPDEYFHMGGDENNGVRVEGQSEDSGLHGCA